MSPRCKRQPPKQALSPRFSAIEVLPFSKYVRPSITIIPMLTRNKELAQKADISNDHFVRTTDKEHKDAVEYAWVCTIACLGDNLADGL